MKSLVPALAAALIGLPGAGGAQQVSQQQIDEAFDSKDAATHDDAFAAAAAAFRAQAAPEVPTPDAGAWAYADDGDAACSLRGRSMGFSYDPYLSDAVLMHIVRTDGAADAAGTVVALSIRIEPADGSAASTFELPAKIGRAPDVYRADIDIGRWIARHPAGFAMTVSRDARPLVRMSTQGAETLFAQLGRCIAR